MDPLTIPGTLDSLSAIGGFVLEAGAEANLDRKAAYKLRLAVDEIATNAILHGYDQNNQTGELFISAEIKEDTLVVTLEDSGPPYDPRETAEPDDIDASLMDREVGGLGVFLALGGVDEFRYKRVDGINYNIFIMIRTKPSGGELND